MSLIIVSRIKPRHPPSLFIPVNIGIKTSFPSLEATAMLAATRVTITNMFLNCSWLNSSCQFSNENDQFGSYNLSSYTFYVGDIEHFTLMLDHAIITLSVGIQRNALSLNGKFLNENGQTITNLQSPNVVGQVGHYDVVELITLLNAAGIQDLDEISGSANNGNETMRYAGLILMVVLEYSNTVSFSLQNVEYTLSARIVKDTEFKAVETIYTDYPRNVTEQNRHGIRMIFLQTGALGKFDFQVLLLNCVSGLGLLAVATVIVDILMTLIMPQRKTYQGYKYQIPEFTYRGIYCLLRLVIRVI
eukprot:TRINITY_DN2823_c0_g1_i1.p1 TRINITY_DN2823_c0_g1~~TRINITY_DN2823_c0_g1_i1.p1  ORF type:complete len:303 (+),score=14.22 TRINITY_DN2823_c0_g1_i1:256-1164(+)